ncbi:formate/nitrite transporter family protein [Schaalia sp. 19OD2882]|uniref:formate/nitrite transporter family protein n=1 Tax=Schaalia sp. 19OD2882 TaxID=2794089 RepID=UPI001C1EFE73|nr:formate/nitrite transporter family protein [Schaalia sp. 19OD2882]QWW20380.1 formate/nitrite transporter family protein [Schaalia sp. 19OD2882]
MLTLTQNIDAQCDAAAHKAHGSASIARYFVAAMMAGAFIGLADVFMITAAVPLRVAGSAAAPLAEGAVFGIGLILTVFAGGELATSAMMILPVGLLERRIGWGPAGRAFILMVLGNLAGAAVLAALVLGSGIMAPDSVGGEALAVLIAAKTHKSTINLFFRAILCNILVCLAMWSVTRTSSDVAKMILMAWCMAAFVASGMEHVVANMTTFCLGLFHQVDHATLWETGRNLGTVLVGNVIGGAFFVGLAQWFASRTKPEEGRH